MPPQQAQVVKDKAKRVNLRNTLCADTTRKANAIRGINAIILTPTLPPLPKAKRAARARVRAKEKMGKANHHNSKGKARKVRAITTSSMGLASGRTNALTRTPPKIGRLRLLWWMRSQRPKLRLKQRLKPKAKLRHILAHYRTAGPHRYRQ